MTERKMPTMNIHAKTEEKTEEQNLNVKNHSEDVETDDQKENVQPVNAESNEDIVALKKQIEELKQQNKTLEEKLLYLAAELQNTKKRNAIDLDNANKFAINKFAIDAVGIFDILQTALNNVDVDATDKTLFDGIKMTIGEFEKMFDRIQIKKINPEIGSVFDHNKHEAISRVPNELEVGCIVNVVRPGYELYGRLLRPAMVIVSGGK